MLSTLDVSSTTQWRQSTGHRSHVIGWGTCQVPPNHLILRDIHWQRPWCRSFLISCLTCRVSTKGTHIPFAKLNDAWRLLTLLVSTCNEKISPESHLQMAVIILAIRNQTDLKIVHEKKGFTYIIRAGVGGLGRVDCIESPTTFKAVSWQSWLSGVRASKKQSHWRALIGMLAKERWLNKLIDWWKKGMSMHHIVAVRGVDRWRGANIIQRSCFASEIKWHCVYLFF